MSSEVQFVIAARSVPLKWILRHETRCSGFTAVKRFTQHNMFLDPTVIYRVITEKCGHKQRCEHWTQWIWYGRYGSGHGSAPERMVLINSVSDKHTHIVEHNRVQSFALYQVHKLVRTIGYKCYRNKILKLNKLIYSLIFDWRPIWCLYINVWANSVVTWEFILISDKWCHESRWSFPMVYIGECACVRERLE